MIGTVRSIPENGVTSPSGALCSHIPQRVATVPAPSWASTAFIIRQDFLVGSVPPESVTVPSVLATLMHGVLCRQTVVTPPSVVTVLPFLSNGAPVITAAAVIMSLLVMVSWFHIVYPLSMPTMDSGRKALQSSRTRSK